MKIQEVNENLIGKRCRTMTFGGLVSGTITEVNRNTFVVRVFVKYDEPIRWGNDSFSGGDAYEEVENGRGSLRYLELID